MKQNRYGKSRDATSMHASIQIRLWVHVLVLQDSRKYHDLTNEELRAVALQEFPNDSERSKASSWCNGMLPGFA